MKNALLILIVFFALCGFPFADASPAADLQLNRAPVKVFFSPHGGCTDAIIGEINAARSEILVQAYSFTSAPIAQALLQAQRRGVRVQVILDRSQRTQRYSSATFFTNAGISLFIDDKHAIAHNKVMIIDRAAVISGSFNFTKAAEEKNAENVVIIHSAPLARLYRDNWQEHRAHSAGSGALSLMKR